MVNGVFIEYHGIQHYHPVKHFGGKKDYNKQVERDESIRKYCENENIRLIEIPYDMPEEEQYKSLRGL